MVMAASLFGHVDSTPTRCHMTKRDTRLANRRSGLPFAPGKDPVGEDRWGSASVPSCARDATHKSDREPPTIASLEAQLSRKVREAPYSYSDLRSSPLGDHEERHVDGWGLLKKHP